MYGNPFLQPVYRDIEVIGEGRRPSAEAAFCVVAGAAAAFLGGSTFFVLAGIALIVVGFCRPMVPVYTIKASRGRGGSLKVIRGVSEYKLEILLRNEAPG